MGVCMYKYIAFKNVRGTTKLNVLLEKPLDTLADLTDKQANIIHYVTTLNNYNFTLASDADTSAITLDDKSFNGDFIFNAVNK